MVLHRRAYQVILLISILVLSMQLVGSTPSQAQDSTATPIESDDSQVLRTGTWASQSAAAASGGSYLYSSGAEADVLTLQFSGPSIEVMYVAGPSLGTLAIDIDGTVLRTVITTADQTAYQQSSRVDYLTNEPHELKVYAQEGGIVGVDAFIIPPALSSDVALTGSAGDVSVRATTCAPLHAIQRVSLTETGGQSTFGSFHSSLSADGQYVAFESAASLIAGDGDTTHDIYVYDRQTCTLQLVSVSSTQQKGNGNSAAPRISANGRYVTYFSLATNLVPDDTNALQDVFVYDRLTGTTTRASVATGGVQATGGNSASPAISADGRYIAYFSQATNLVAGDTNGTFDVFLFDTQTITTIRVSVATGGAQGNDFSTSPAISAHGEYVTYHSLATNLIVGDTNGQADTFVYDRLAGTTTRVSVATGGTQATGGPSFDTAISADGRYVVFTSGATNLVAGDTNGLLDIFVHDRETLTTTRVSTATGGIQSIGGDAVRVAISSDGRYVGFESAATNLVAGDTNNSNDSFVHDRQTGRTVRISVAADGTQAAAGNSERMVLSPDGRYAAFESPAPNLVANDTNNVHDIFVVPVQLPAPDTLALFNPPFQQVNLISSLADNPPARAYTAFSAYAPVSGGQWVMGDWDGDGLDTPGVYANGPFFFTNKSGESQPSDWGGFWIGINGPVVAGRFSNAPNDCVGAVDSGLGGNVNFFALYFTCDMSGATATPALTFQWLSTPLPNPTFNGTFQFGAGDFDGDGLDSIAVRRNEFIAFGNVTPSAGNAVYDLAQFIGTPGQGDGGTLVVGDWDGSGADSFGLFYQNGELFYRNDLDFNSGAYVNQSVGAPFGNAGVQVATWR